MLLCADVRWKGGPITTATSREVLVNASPEGTYVWERTRHNNTGDGLSSQVTQRATELDHGSLSVVGFFFAKKYANYFDLRRPPMLTAFCPQF